MRRRTLAVLTMLLCLLCACGGKENSPLQTPIDFRADLLNSGGCSFQAQISAEVEERMYDLTLDCSCLSGGTARVTVLAPETIAGVCAETDGKTGKLLYDGLSLAFGLPCDQRLAPVAMPAAVCRAWAEGMITSTGQEEEGLLAVYSMGSDDPVTVRTWFGPEGTPIRAELVWMGRVCGRMQIADYQTENIQTTGGSYEAAEEDLG